MPFSRYKNKIRLLLVCISVGIVGAILWNTYSFFQQFKDEERDKMDNWAAAQQSIITADEDENVDLAFKVITGNYSNPMIYVSVDGWFSTNNINKEKAKDSLFIKERIAVFEQENEPIDIIYNGERFGTLYYGNSNVLNNLKYYPLALLLIIFLFSTVVFFFYRTARISDQNKLLAGMAKETAHQIGTPLSSLLGWPEILKSQQVDPSIISEIEKDVNRLETITDRFSKIGSSPALEVADIVTETKLAFDYLKLRTSQQVIYSIHLPDKVIPVRLNKQLYGWTIENLVKNAIDAMRGKGQITVTMEYFGNILKIQIADTGKGIAKKNYKRIFEPGFTTKKRGWGLGLSLVKRIIEDYHGGRVKVLSSELGKGSTIQLQLYTATKT